jgi:hypothetical protein
VYGLGAIHKAKDNSVKEILAEPELFVEFLRSFVPIDILKNIVPADIEDVTTRLISLVSEQKDGDTIKRINLNEGKSLFVITIVEHESQVNFRAPFKMLLYIALILDAYEREAYKETGNSTAVNQTRDFKYPPILPIIFYDGQSEWTAETNFLYRTEMHEIFEKYIPKFEYELVSLKDYSFTDLVDFGNTLSLFMMVDKLQTDEAFRELGNFPNEYIKRMDEMNIPLHLKKLLVKVITVLLNRINVPQGEIDTLLERIDERGISEMLSIANYDVQAVRREAEQERDEAKRRLKAAVIALLDKGSTITEIANIMNVAEDDVTTLLPELAPA